MEDGGGVTGTSHTQNITTVNEAIHIINPELAIKNNRKMYIRAYVRRTNKMHTF